MGQLRNDFDRDGFAIIRNVFSQDEVDYLKKRISEFLHYNLSKFHAGDVYYEADGRLKTIMRFQRNDPWFGVLMQYPRLVTIASEAFGVPAKGVDTTYFPKYAHSGSATPPHQDNAFDCLEPPESLVLTIALDASDEDNGQLVCVPESHKKGLLPHEASGIPGFSQRLKDWPPPADPMSFSYSAGFLMLPGDVSIHHANTIHWSDANNSDRDRRQFAIIYRTERAKEDPVRAAKYREQLAQLHADKGLT